MGTQHEDTSWPENRKLSTYMLHSIILSVVIQSAFILWFWAHYWKQTNVYCLCAEYTSVSSFRNGWFPTFTWHHCYNLLGTKWQHSQSCFSIDRAHDVSLLQLPFAEFDNCVFTFRQIPFPEIRVVCSLFCSTPCWQPFKILCNKTTQQQPKNEMHLNVDCYLNSSAERLLTGHW